MFRKKKYKTDGNIVTQRQLYRRAKKARDDLANQNVLNSLLTDDIELVTPLEFANLDDRSSFTNVFVEHVTPLAFDNLNDNSLQVVDLPDDEILQLSNSNSCNNFAVENCTNFLTNEFNNNYTNSTQRSSHSLLTSDLCQCVIEHNVPRTFVNRLLKVLKPFHSELPTDYRTLLKSNITFDTKKISDGEYVHIGLKKQIQQKLLIHTNISETIEISFNVDGIPLFKSSNLSFWPILGLIKNIKSKPFVVGIFCGTSKPVPLELFLEDFIKEMLELMNVGFEFNKKYYKIKIHSFICDAPAKAYIKCIKPHNGYASCDRCTEYGSYVNNRVILKCINKSERTHDSFISQIDEEHHIGVTPLIQLPINMIECFVIDYMHNVCLGVMRKLLNTWISGDLTVRLSGIAVKTLSDYLVSIKKYIPIEINRKPRSLQELQRWKATEYRTFLLYLGPFVLKKVLNLGMYEHFLLLHCGILIFTSKHLILKYFNIAVECLKTFVTHSSKIYSLKFLIYNVHMLCHLGDDVQRLGPLDSFSAFAFESYLGQLKNLIKSPVKPLQQVCRRLHEINLNMSKNEAENMRCELEYNLGPLPSNCQQVKQFKKCNFDNFILTVNNYSISDSYFSTKEGIVVQIQNILLDLQNNHIYFLGKRFCQYSNLYEYPFESKNVYIYKVFSLSSTLEIWSTECILSKCIVIPDKNEKDQWISMPLLHTL